MATRVLPGGVAMGRSFESVRMEVKEVSARWLKASRALKKEDQIHGQRLAEMVKKHSSEAFYAFDDPLEAAVFSVLVEITRDMKSDEKKIKDLNRIG
jgi:hypothetical protein